MKSKASKKGGGLPSAQKLSSAFAAALGGDVTKKQAQLPFAANGKGPHSRADQINKAPKPAGGANRTVAPGKGHR